MNLLLIIKQTKTKFLDYIVLTKCYILKYITTKDNRKFFDVDLMRYIT